MKKAEVNNLADISLYGCNIDELQNWCGYGTTPLWASRALKDSGYRFPMGKEKRVGLDQI